MGSYPSKLGTFQADPGLAHQGFVANLGSIRLEAYRVSDQAEREPPCTVDNRRRSDDRNLHSDGCIVRTYSTSILVFD